MRSFDLTFNGAVLPDCDPSQVRQDLAGLFSIEDSGLVEEMFSGKTVILRHSLDRKTAADYFRKITQLGAEVALVASPKYRALRGDELLVLEMNERAQPVPTSEPDTKSAPEPELELELVLQTEPELELQPESEPEVELEPGSEPDFELEPKPALEPEPGLAQQQPAAETITSVPVAAANETQDLAEIEKRREAEEQERLEALKTEASKAAQRREASLERQRNQYDRLAREELDKLDQLSRSNSARAERELTKLNALVDSTAQEAAAQVADIDWEKSACEDRSRESIDRLDHLIYMAQTEAEAFREVIEQRLQKTRQENDEEIRQLEEQLAEARKRGHKAVSDLELELKNTREKSWEEIEELEKEKDTSLSSATEELAALDVQQVSVQAELELKRAEIKLEEQAIRDREREEAQRLAALKEEIRMRRDEGIASVDRAITELREETHSTLQQLKAPERENLTLLEKTGLTDRAVSSGNS